MATLPEALALAIQHHQAGRLAEAEQIYRQILAVAPDQVDALHMLGLMAHQAGRHDLAVQYIGRALQLNPDCAEAYYNLGVVWQSQGKPDEAVACYRRALELNPGYAEAHSNLGNALKEQGKLDEAVACYRRALQLKPGYIKAHSNLGNALKEQGKLDEAVACYRRALELKPDFAEAHSNLGNALSDQGKLDEALACYRRALELRPDLAGAHSNLGHALCEQGKPDQAEACCRRAVELKPDHAVAHNNLGIALCEQGKLDAAEACYRRALELASDYAEAHSNLANALHGQGRLREAEACYRRALELKPDYAEAHNNQAMLWLLRGDFQRGWPEYEWRWRPKKAPAPRRFPQPAWDGSPLAGKTCLLYAEQGFGDTIQFVRYARVLQQSGARVVFQCPRPLLRLLGSCPGIDRLLAQGDDLPPFDVHVPLLSVPALVGTRIDTIPAEVPYLQAEAELVERWRAKLAGTEGFKVGVNWRGRPGPGPWTRRDIPLQHFGALAAVPSVRLVRLQRAEEAGGERTGQPPPWLWEPGCATDEAGAFIDTAAIMKNLDLVITSDTAVAHLAGALGVPVWVALPFAPDWRWMLDRADSPWYPTMCLFRQKSPGDWAGVLNEIAMVLRQRLPPG